MPIGRIPHGIRGLKSDKKFLFAHHGKSYPSRDTWIEIIMILMIRYCSIRSYPSRDTWIEILLSLLIMLILIVVSLTGYVD